MIDFLGFAPSTVAAAAVISAAGKNFDTIPLKAGVGRFFHERVNRVNIYNLCGVIDNFCCPWGLFWKYIHTYICIYVYTYIFIYLFIFPIFTTFTRIN